MNLSETLRVRMAMLSRRSVAPVSRVATTAWMRRRLGHASRRPDFTVIGIYRRENAPLVHAAIDGLSDVRLWALDQPAPELASVTVGSGPGDRIEHLNHLLEPRTADYLVVMDDDIRFVTGSISRLVEVAARHRLDLCQPAQSVNGHWSHPITVRHVLSAVRLTNFVEVGPLVVIGPRLRHEILPFPPDAGQGWGLDVRWSKLCETHRARLAVVDAVEVEHLGAVGTSYSWDAEEARLLEALQEQGHAEVEDLVSLPKTRSWVRPWAI